MSEELTINAIIWSYINKINKIFDNFDDLEGFEEIKEEWDDLSKNNDELIENEKRLCQIYLFIYKNKNYLIKNNLEINEEHRKEGCCENKEFPNNFKNIIKIIEEIKNDGVKLTCSNLVRMIINQEVNRRLNLTSIKFDYINSLIINDEDFRQFLCDAQNDKILVIKTKIIEFIEINYLDELELIHPDVLKIHIIHPYSRAYYYQIITENTKGSLKSINAEIRLASPYLLYLITLLENKKQGYLDKRSIIFIEKFNWLRQILFDNKSFKLISKLGICLIQNFIEVAYPKEEINEKVLIENWEGEECEDENKIEEKFLEQRKILKELHQVFAENSFEALKEITKMPGAKSRLEILFPDILMNPLLEDEDCEFLFLLFLLLQI
uniref:Uncharacterized protein n=1 Tax=Meloidogyne hapla TaxID=6305 RepID=A0A1I8AZV2_MELHA